MNSPILPRLPKPEPSVERFRQVLQRSPCDRVPLVELAIAEETLTALHGGPLIPLSRQEGAQRFREAIRQRVGLWRANQDSRCCTMLVSLFRKPTLYLLNQAAGIPNGTSARRESAPVAKWAQWGRSAGMYPAYYLRIV